MEAQNYASEVNAAREQVRRLRDRLLQRTIHRVTSRSGRRPGLYVHPEQKLSPSGEGSLGASIEATLAQLVAACLLDPSTMLPLDIETLHKRASVAGVFETL